MRIDLSVVLWQATFAIAEVGGCHENVYSISQRVAEELQVDEICSYNMTLLLQLIQGMFHLSRRELKFVGNLLVLSHRILVNVARNCT